MEITPRHESIKSLFGTARIFRVPKYQRHYSWKPEEIEDLLKDLDKGVKARQAGKEYLHFFGGLVTVSRPHGGSAVKLEVIDGQQRLATFVLLAAQLIRSMQALAAAIDEAAHSELKKFLSDRMSTLHKQFLRLDDTVALKVEDVARLELSKPDKVFFVQLLDGTAPEALERESHRLLMGAYDMIGKYFADLVAEATSPQAKVTELANVAMVIETDWTVIHMETTKLSYAYNLFQVLNDRGVGLTEGELLRAKTLELLDGVGSQDQMDRLEAAWDEILSESPARIEDVLRWVFASHKGIRPGKTTLFDEFLEHLCPTHQSTLNASGANALVKAVEDLQRDFKKVTWMLDGEWPFAGPTSVGAWERDRLNLLLRELKHTNCMPLLIAGTALSQKAFSNLVQVLERFVFRYKLVSNAHIGPATAVYNQQAAALRANVAGFKLASLRTMLSGLLTNHASDSRFTTNLGELEYSTVASNKVIKYFLTTVEHYARWYYEGAKGSPTCKDKSRLLDFASTTLEHIHPQNGVSSGTTLGGLIHSIGNLTILGPSDNNAAGNKPFADKRPILASSTILLNNKIATRPTWTAASISGWSDELKAMALKIFVV